MTAEGIPANAKQLAAVVKEGEGQAPEFKRSTGELKEGMQTLCAFLDGSGGVVLFGVRPEGTIEGQAVSDRTLRDIAQAADRFEPPAHLSIHRIKLKANREVLVAAVEGRRDVRPYTYEGRAYERAESTTRRMPQAKYERLLVERGHAKRRWENLPADGLTLKDLDRKEILRTRELAIQQNRISPDTSRDIGEILDRLGLRINSVLTQAAYMLCGKRFLEGETNSSTRRRPIAYLWARTVRCEAPNCGAEIPIYRSPWLSRRGIARATSRKRLTARALRSLSIAHLMVGRSRFESLRGTPAKSQGTVS